MNNFESRVLVLGKFKFINHKNAIYFQMAIFIFQILEQFIFCFSSQNRIAASNTPQYLWTQTSLYWYLGQSDKEPEYYLPLLLVPVHVYPR